MPKDKPSAQYVRFSEIGNAVDYLERAGAAIRALRRDPLQWKWVIIGLYGALYSVAVCALAGSDWTRVTTGKRGRLIGFPEAVTRVQDPRWMAQFVRSKPLTLTPDQKTSVAHIRKLRNRLEHYVPLYWSLEKHGLTQSAVDVLDVIRFIALDSGNVRLNRAQRDTVLAAISKGTAALQQTQLYKDYLAAKRRLARSRDQGLA